MIEVCEHGIIDGVYFTLDARALSGHIEEIGRVVYTTDHEWVAGECTKVADEGGTCEPV